jgi:hypothetical protein
MDDLFSILIYLVIIISFLSSIFKKKKTEGPPQQQRRVPQDRIPDEETIPEESYANSGSSDYDIMREVENMFKTEEQKMREAQERIREANEKRTKLEEAARSSRVKTPSERISYEEYAAREESVFDADKPTAVRDYSEGKVDRREHTYAEPRKRQTKIDSRIEEQARRFQELLEKRSYQQEKFTADLVRKIKDPKTIREYILVGEILARPKALRR